MLFTIGCEGTKNIKNQFYSPLFISKFAIINKNTDMKRPVIIASIILTLAFAVSCKSGETASSANVYALPKAIVYKTSGDYNKNVPVILNSEKTAVVGYPSKSDIYYNGEFAYPLVLNGGYLLDRRGINLNVAFLDLTYEEYSKLTAQPSAGDLFKRIINKNPLTELWECERPSDLKDESEYFNKVIENGFKNCRSVFKMPFVK